jgi:hypothetical protein
MKFFPGLSRNKNIPQKRDCILGDEGLKTLEAMIKSFEVIGRDLSNPPRNFKARAHIAHAVLEYARALRTINPDDLVIAQIEKTARKFLKDLTGLKEE